MKVRVERLAGGWVRLTEDHKTGGFSWQMTKEEAKELGQKLVKASK